VISGTGRSTTFDYSSVPCHNSFKCLVCTLRHTVVNPPLRIASTSSALPLALAGLPRFECDEAPAGERDLALLALVTRISCFVITVQKQYDLRTVA
jgi:hypothetical protein